MASDGGRSRPRRLVASGAGSTHPGCARTLNEDALLTDPTGALWAVADGIGGLGHGDLAADIVIDALTRVPHGAAGPEPLATALAGAHAAVRAHAAAAALGTIGATVVAALIGGEAATIGWAGDSRCYLKRGGALAQVTRDHSVVQDLVADGRLDPSQVEAHPEAHVITRAIGATDDFEPEYESVPLEAGDRLLLCSDGLTRCVGDAEIAAILDRMPAPADAVQALVAAALARGAPDNVSVVVVGLADGGE